jgi:hypothetical protein
MQLSSAWRAVREKLPVTSVRSLSSALPSALPSWRSVREKLPIPQSRLARSLASTAVVVILSAAAGGRAAGPVLIARVEAPSPAPTAGVAPAQKIAQAPHVAAPVVPVNYAPPDVAHVAPAQAPALSAAPDAAGATGTDAVPSPQVTAPPAADTGPDGAIAEQLHSSTASSAPAPRMTEPPSTRSIPAVAMRRCGSPTASRMPGQRQQLRISSMSTPTGSIPPTIRFRILQR